MYKKEYVQTFLEKQGQLFDEPVADDFEEAEAFLEDCMAVVLDSLKDVKKYLLENRQLLNQITFQGIKDNNAQLRHMVRNA